MEIINKKIAELVTDNYVFASVLHYFGIQFYQYPEQTLEAVCKQMHINPEVVIQRLEAAGEVQQNPYFSLMGYPVEVVMKYLRHAHNIFIKYKLPYITHLIKTLDVDMFANPQLAKDLQLVFPLFAEDFISHIYEEEDTLFQYINTLIKATERIENASGLYYQMEKHAIKDFSAQHESHDDEMAGIRSLTDNYRQGGETSLHVRILYAELMAFEQELVTHANIENRILFPKALKLENEVKWRLQQKIKQN